MNTHFIEFGLGEEESYGRPRRPIYWKRKDTLFKILKCWFIKKIS